jgi:hypothetical protein
MFESVKDWHKGWCIFVEISSLWQVKLHGSPELFSCI